MNVDSESGYALKNDKVSLYLPSTRLPVQFDAWLWKVPVGHVVENKIGLLVSNMGQDPVRFSLMEKYSPTGDQPWPNTPGIFALDHESGQAQVFDQTLSGRELERVVQHFSDLARRGSHIHCTLCANLQPAKNVDTKIIASKETSSRHSP